MTKVDTIINTLNPSMIQCYQCGKWVEDSDFFTDVRRLQLGDDGLYKAPITFKKVYCSSWCHAQHRRGHSSKWNRK